ncbi:sulfotransferase family protein [Sulfitobacter sp. F26204]|uniref:sulfotransferase family protein n=1 Tax=Sulfitobacter sp. F26204 TaxID=2996014 RepID=UPI00225DD1CF|nr:sulfotransferase family protein [Sulfitobacter sp. F26204]MCX7559481.1 sulfotransferase family protein [Sulfitobacter sp. F26204]
MISNPIISLSLPKSGTTTLAVALRHAGLKVIDWRIRQGQSANPALKGALIAPLMYEDYFDSGDPLARLGEFHAVTEMSAVNNRMSMWPQTDSGMLSAILHHHPGARFVLSLRDPTDVANSIMGWNNLGKIRLPRNDVPGLPRPYGGDIKHLTRWVEGHYNFCARFFRNSPNFLAYKLEDRNVRADISRFLGLELPWWGKANVNKNPAQPVKTSTIAPEGQGNDEA